VTELDTRVADYFARPRTVGEWWAPELGPLRFHYEAELQVLDDVLEVAPGERVLDVGTGRGRFGNWFAERGCRVIGVDLNPDMLEAARENARRLGLAGRFEVRRAGAEDLAALGEAPFRRVTCMELFDHLPDLGAALRSMRGVLEPGGELLFTYVPSESLYGMLGNAYRWWTARRRPQELLISRTYRLGAIRRALAASGFRLERWWGVGVLCINAQTRLFGDSPLARALLALARAEARRRPYHSAPWLARHAAHVVGLARADGGAA
jgi:ubiquinone/menaquinone biosynthesis C-methylase UbiE